MVGVGYRLDMDEPDGVIHDQTDALKRALVALVLRRPARQRSPALQPMLYGVGYGIDGRSSATLNPEPRVRPHPVRHFGLLKRLRNWVHAGVLRHERASVVRMRINPDSVQVVVDRAEFAHESPPPALVSVRDRCVLVWLRWSRNLDPLGGPQRRFVSR